MKAFDVNEYRRTVLAKIKDDHSLADPATGDVMWVCAVESGASATEALKRLDDVHAAWQKDRNSPKYKGICAVLVGHREAYAQVLKNPEARAQASARHEEENAAKTTKAIEELNSVARDLLKARGGIPAEVLEHGAGSRRCAPSPNRTGWARRRSRTGWPGRTCSPRSAVSARCRGSRWCAGRCVRS